VPRSRDDVVVVAGARTPIGRFGGAFKNLRAYQLAALAMQETIRRAGIEPGLLDEVVAGDCAQAMDEANTARTALLAAGFPVEVPAYTVQKNCSSGMQALWSARTQIMSGDSDLVLAVGVESMSNTPYVLKTARWGQRLMHGEMSDGIWDLLHAGSILVGEKMLMGVTAENLAEMYCISREEQDEVALRSHNNAESAIVEGRFADEIVAVSVKGKKGDVLVDTDEHPRMGATLADFSKMDPAFREGGTVTAGNSSGLNDAAAAVLVCSRAKARELGLKPMVRVVGQASAGVKPEIMGYGPVPATQKLVAKTGVSLSEVGLFEVNEAFAAQYLACERGLSLDRDRVNVNGSGIGLGHPVGCTGLRIVLSLIYEMMRRRERYGLATLCIGGGMGMSTLLELEE